MQNYKFVIDLNKPAGHYDGGLAAYITGVQNDKDGDADIYAYMQDMGYIYADDNPFEEMVDKDLDNSSNIVYFTTIITPGWFNDGMGNCYPEDNYNEEEAVAIYNQSKLDYAATINEKYRNKYLEANPPITQINKFPCYNSLAIHFKELPYEDEIELLKTRSRKYCEKHNIMVVGFRLITETLITEEYPL